MIVFIDYSEVQNAVSGQKCLFLNVQCSIFSLLFFQPTQFILHFSFNITVILPVFFCPDFYVCCVYSNALWTSFDHGSKRNESR